VHDLVINSIRDQEQEDQRLKQRTSGGDGPFSDLLNLGSRQRLPIAAFERLTYPRAASATRQAALSGQSSKAPGFAGGCLLERSSAAVTAAPVYADLQWRNAALEFSGKVEQEYSHLWNVQGDGR
jgi:hypothetical protein